jgi:hypothetical protein
MIVQKIIVRGLLFVVTLAAIYHKNVPRRDSKRKIHRCNNNMSQILLLLLVVE